MRFRIESRCSWVAAFWEAPVDFQIRERRQAAGSESSKRVVSASAQRDVISDCQHSETMNRFDKSTPWASNVQAEWRAGDVGTPGWTPSALGRSGSRVGKK